jgi:hypothetical protein
MKNAVITSQVVDAVKRALSSENRFKPESIKYELQDDEQNLLISISIDDLQTADLAMTLRPIGSLLNALIPGRKGDYTWMVVFTKSGKVVDSYFGGDLDCPNSGL